MYRRIVSTASVAALVFAWAGTASAAALPVNGNVSCTTLTGVKLAPDASLTAKPPLGTGFAPTRVVGKFKEKLAIGGGATGCTGTQTGTKDGLPIDSLSVKAKLNIPFVGGVCNGGNNKGTACTTDTDCQGVCENGTNNGTVCNSDTTCTGGGDCTGSVCGDTYPSCGALATGTFSLSSALNPVVQIKWTHTDPVTLKAKPVAKSFLGTFEIGDFNTAAILAGSRITATLSGTVTKGAFLGQPVSLAIAVSGTDGVAGDGNLTQLLGACTSCTCDKGVTNPCDGASATSPKGCDKGTGLFSLDFRGLTAADCTDVGDPAACCTGPGTGTCVAVSLPDCLATGQVCTTGSQCCSTSCTAGACD